MDPLLATDFRILVKAICQACNVPMYDLPGLPKYQDSTGRLTICWNNMLKGCGWSECPLKRIGGHVFRDKITNGFANAVCCCVSYPPVIGGSFLITRYQSLDLSAR
jgi:hypothetical protein